MNKKLTRQDILNQLPKHLQGRTLHIVGPNDDYDQEEEEDENIDPEYDEMVVPDDVVQKRLTIEMEKENQIQSSSNFSDLRLTKHFREQKKFEPVYTGGKILIMNDEVHALAMNNLKVTLYNIKNSQVYGTHVQENEDISTFSLSPNQEFFATANKNFMIRIFKMPQNEFFHQNIQSGDFNKMECIKMFKTTNQLTIEMVFDPTSKFLACGTSDSHIKVFDIKKGFQTHNFLGHRGIITKLSFFPGADDTLKLISCAEDFVIRVWDLVMKKEIGQMKPKGKDDNMAHMTTSIVFTSDKKTIISGGRDGCLHFWNAHDNFKHISTIKLETLGGLKYDEINQMVYIKQKEDPCLILGCLSGQVAVYSINRQKIVFQANESRFLDSNFDKEFDPQNNSNSNEIVYMQYLKQRNQICVINADQNALFYELDYKDQQKQKSETQISSGFFNRLNLIESHCLYLDEIIDAKFINYSKQAIFCSNSETLKLIDMHNDILEKENLNGGGHCELYAGHKDIIISIDKFYPFKCESNSSKHDETKAFILTGAKDSEIRLWKFNSNAPKFHKIKCIAIFKGHNQNICSVSFAPKKGLSFVSASQDNTIKQWDLTNFIQEDFDQESQEIHVINQAQLTVMAHQKYINIAKYSPNDKLIASASQDKTIKIWSAKNLQLLAQLSGHKKNVWDIQFSPYEKQIVSVSGDKLIKVWNIQPISDTKNIGQQKCECIATLQGHQDQLVKVQWINMGLQIASASIDGVVKIWNLKKQQCMNTFEMHNDKIWTMDLYEKIEEEINSEDEVQYKSKIFLITGGCDSTIKLWQDFTEEQELEDKNAELQKIQEEQKLSHLIRQEDFMEAALLAFKLNKLRDFYHVLNKILLLKNSQSNQMDQVDSVILDFKKFEILKNCDFQLSKAIEMNQEGKDKSKQIFEEIVKKLFKKDKVRLLTIIRNLNAKYEYSHLAQELLLSIMSSFDCENYLKSFKKAAELIDQQNQKNEKKKKEIPPEIRNVLEGILLYEEKHYERAEKLLRCSYFVDYVLSQMTLDEQKQSVKIAENENLSIEASSRYNKRVKKQMEKEKKLLSQTDNQQEKQKKQKIENLITSSV